MGTAKTEIDWFNITDEDVARKESALKTMLDMMDIPEMRKNLTRGSIAWLGRNLAVRNRNHPMFSTASDLITWLARWHRKNC